MGSLRGWLAVSILPLALGCYSFVPARLDAKPPPIARRWPQPVSVAATPRENPLSRFTPEGHIYEANLDDFSQELARLLRETLQNGGATVAPGHRSIEVQVVYVDFMFQGPCLVDFDTRLGSGEVFGLQSSGDSMYFEKACRLAFESAVKQVLDDPRTVAYLGAP